MSRLDRQLIGAVFLKAPDYRFPPGSCSASASLFLTNRFDIVLDATIASALSYGQIGTGLQGRYATLLESEGMLIRPAERNDLQAVQQIYALEVLEATGSFELTPPDLAEMERRYQAVLDAGLPYLVAVVDDEVAGFAYAHPYKDRPGYRMTAETTIYLARGHRRQGLGSALLKAIIEAAEKAGIRQLVAVIGDSVNHGSIGVHAKAGFRHVGTLKDVGYKFDRFLDVVMMQRSLGNDRPAG